MTGCVLGLAFVIPLRKQMIDFDRLAYPGGIAVATILKSPGAGVRKAVLLLSGAVFSGVVHVLVKQLLSEESWQAGDGPAAAVDAEHQLLSVRDDDWCRLLVGQGRFLVRSRRLLCATGCSRPFWLTSVPQR